MIAYGLRAEYAGTVEQRFPADAEHPADADDGTYGVEVPAFTGGVISYGDGATFDVREELADDGVIVVDEGNHTLVLALDEYPALKRVSVPAGAQVAGDTVGYPGMTVSALRAEARRRGLKGFSGLGRDVLELALTEHDRRLAAGDPDAQAADDHEVRILEDGNLETPADRAGVPGVNADDTKPNPEA